MLQKPRAPPTKRKAALPTRAGGQTLKNNLHETSQFHCSRFGGLSASH